MRKLKLLILSLVAVFCTGTAFATIPANGTSGYFYNPATGKFMSHGVTSLSSSGAKVDNYGVIIDVTNEGSVSEFSDATYNYIRFQMGDYHGRYLKINSNGLSCDGASYHKWAVREVSDGNFVIRCIYKSSQVAYATQEYYVAINLDDELVLVDGLENAAVWQFVDAATQKSIVASAADTRASLIGASAGLAVSSLSDLETAVSSMNALDKTDAITNPTMYSNTDGWTVTNVQGTAISNGSYQIQNAAGGQSTCKQTVTGLPAGLYKVTVQSFYRASVLSRCVTYGDAGYTFSNAYFKANDNEVLIKDWYEISTDNHSKPTSRGQISADFNNDAKYTNTVYTYVGDDGNLDLTIAVPSYSAGNYPNWICYNNVTLTYYYSAEDLSAYEAQLAASVNAANAMDLPTYQKSVLDAVVTANNNTYTTSADYQAAIDAIDAAKVVAEPYVAPYAAYKSLKSLVEEKFISQTTIYTDNANATDAYATSVSSSDLNVEDARAVATITEETTNVWNAALSFLKSVTVNDGEYFDLTWMIQNPGFDNTSYKNYWTETGVTGGTVGVTNGVMRYMSTAFDLGQTLAYVLPAGYYELQVYGFERTHNPLSTAYSNFTAGTSNVSGTIYLNNDEQLIHNLFDVQTVTNNSLSGAQPSGASFYVPDGSSAANKYFAAGHYLNTLTAVMVSDSEVTLGYRCSNADEWTCFDNFQLHYFGTLDLSDYEEQLALAVSKAQNLVIPTLPKRQLTDIVQQNNKTYTSAEAYQTAIANINAAIAVAEPYVEPYAEYNTLRTMIQERIVSQTSVYADPDDAADAYSSVLSSVNSSVENVNSVEAIETQKTNLWNAALTFMKSVSINENMGFDLTWMIGDPDFSDSNYKNYWTEECTSSNAHGCTSGVLRYYNSPFDVYQTLPYTLPAGAYKMTVDGFERNGDPMNTAWSTYQTEGNTATGVLYLNNNEQVIMDLFDYQGKTDSGWSGSKPDGATFYVPNGSGAANQYLSNGVYPNTLIGILADDGDVTIGYRCSNSVAWTCVDNFKLWYIGEVPQVTLNNQADEQTPVCAPFTLSTDDADVEELYALAGEKEGHIYIYSVNTVPAGSPCYAKFSIANYSAPMEMTLSDGKKFVMPWSGGWTSVDAANNSWDYYEMEGSEIPISGLSTEVLDFNEMSFDVNLENLAARRYLNLVSYSGSGDASEVATYNVAPPTRRDIPNAVMIPLPAHDEDMEITVQNSDLEDVANVTAPAGVSEVYVYNLIPQEYYYFHTDTDYSGEFQTTGNLRMVYAPSAYNIRDLGGWETQDRHRTTYGHLFRGSTLNGYVNCTPEDLQTLKDLGIGGEIDLRYQESYDKDMGCGTSAFGFGADDYYFAAANDWTAANLNESGTQQRLKAEFDFILDHFRQGKAVYYHCAWGADRTGMLSFLMEGVLGLTLDQIYKDYELTSFSAAPSATNRLKTSFQDRIDVILALDGATLRDKFENYFINKMGVSMDDINYFRSVMLEVYPLTVDEDADVTAYYNGLADITLKRTLKAGMHNTVVLPCDMPLWKAQYVFGGDVKMERITAYDDVLVTEEINEAPANTPFLLIPSEIRSDNTYLLDKVTVHEGELTDAEFTNGKLVGSYAASTVINKSEDSSLTNYVISNDRFYFIDSTPATMKSTRAYLVLNTPVGGAKSVVTFGDGIADGIETLTVDDLNNATIYDLSGRRVSNPARGIYIVNGKKVIVK